MRRVLLDVLACPHCRGPLVADSDADRIEHGALSCTPCGRSWPVVDGTPNFVEGQTAAREAFTAQWYERLLGGFERDGQLYGHDPAALMHWIFDNCFSPPAPGSWALDAGCGSGEKAAAVARAWPELQVLALDIADSVQAVAAAARDLPNLHIVQADVMNLPLRQGRFARAWSYGVLHHIPDPVGGLAALRSTLAPRGQLAIWMFPHASESPWHARYYLFRDLVFFGRGHLLTPARRLSAVRVAVTLTFPLLWWISRSTISAPMVDRPYAVIKRLSLAERWRSFVFVFHDNITPEHQSRHRRAEVIGWLRDAGGEAPDTDEQGLYWATFPS